VALAIVAAALGWRRSALVVAALSIAVLLFFRIPTRRSGAANGLVLAPANGVITKIDTVEEGSLGEKPSRRVVTFLSVFNIHVQRSPVSGEVVESLYTPGRKVAAFREDAGEVNENHWTVVEDEEGRRFGIRQIAGLLARRVVSYTEVGDDLERGELMGVIKFGSRVDLYVPGDYRLEVTEGQKLVEGETVVASPPTPEAGNPEETDAQETDA